MDRTDGYVRELNYTNTHYPGLAPARLDLACLSRSVFTRLDGRPLRYLELAFGQGVSLSIHAAASPGEFWGIDFNPDHLRSAREMAAASGSGVRLFEDSFADFAARDDVPQFDAITMHGVWSWVSAENRRVVVDIVRRKLAKGGVFYVSYNCLPGWASRMPLRHLLVEHASLAGSSAPGLSARIDAALEFAGSLENAGAGYFGAHPELKEWLSRMRGASRNYLAHEYFNRDFEPMPSSEVAGLLSAAGLTFAASATLTDHFVGLALPEESRALLAGIEPPTLRETVADYLVNQSFRADIFVMGRPWLGAAARDERLRSLPFMLIRHPDHVPSRIAMAGRDVELHPDIYRPLIEALAEDDYAPKTLGQAQAHPRCASIPLAQLFEAAVMLTGVGSVHPAQAPPAIEQVAPRCAALNAYILDRAEATDDLPALASPVLGAGVFANRHDMLFIRAIERGYAAPEQWARHAWERLEANGQRLVVDGKPLGRREERLARLLVDADAFAKTRLPLLKALRIT